MTWLVAIAVFCAVAAPAQAYVYWTDGGAGTIGRANLDGSGVQAGFITGAGSPRGIAVDGDHVYWADDVHRRVRPDRYTLTLRQGNRIVRRARIRIR